MNKDILKAIILELETIIEISQSLRYSDKQDVLINRLNELKKLH